MKICVIGAGVVGCATAYALTRAGHDVVQLEASAQPGTGTSLANGAQLSYSYVEPMASPATLMALPGLLLSADSALELRLKWDTKQWAWLLKFAFACNPAQASRGTLSLLALAALSRKKLDEWLDTNALEFALQRNGKLVLCADKITLARQAKLVRLQAGAGAIQEILDRKGCVDREPALANYPDFVGGVWTASECAGDPLQYCAALVAAATRRGLDARFSTRALRFVIKNGRVASLQTDSAPVIADAYVLATGIDAPALASQLGERLSIYPVKGYSLTLRLRPGADTGTASPVTSVTDLKHKTVLAPLNGRLRVAAMAGIVGNDLSIPAAKIDQMISIVEKIYPKLCDFSDANDLGAWAGLRPATPNALPVVRPSRLPNVFLNVGHGALGFTLAAGCAVQIANAIHESQALRATVSPTRQKTHLL